MSCLALGTWDPRAATSAGATDHDRRWLKLLRQAREVGITVVDTADVYQDGAAERVIGRWLRDCDRREVVIATKVGGRTWAGPHGEGIGRKHLREACEASLRRLGTDYVDLYQLHAPDSGTPIEEVVETLDHLVQAGKILYWGLSNWSVSSAREVAGYARAAHRAPPVSLQNGLNLLRANKAPGYSDLDGLGLLAYSPLAQGLLADRQLDGRAARGSRVAGDGDQLRRLERRRARLQRLAAVAADQGLTLAQLGIAWLLHQPSVAGVVLGVSGRAQLRENVVAAEVTLPESVLRRIGPVPVPQSAGG